MIPLIDTWPKKKKKRKKQRRHNEIIDYAFVEHCAVRIIIASAEVATLLIAM